MPLSDATSAVPHTTQNTKRKVSQSDFENAILLNELTAAKVYNLNKLKDLFIRKNVVDANHLTKIKVFKNKAIIFILHSSKSQTTINHRLQAIRCRVH